MRNKWKGFIIMILVSVMFLVSCAPSSVVRVTEPNGKIIAENQQNSSQKNPEKKQQIDNKEKPKDSKVKNTKEDNSIKGQADLGSNQRNNTNASGSNQNSNASAPSATVSNTGTSGSGSSNGSGSGSSNESATQQQQTPPTTQSAAPAPQPAKDTTVFSPAGTQVVDIGSNHNVPIPQGVKTVAAAGQYASIVGMVGGGSSIVGTSDDNAQAGSLFSTVFENGNSIPSYMPDAGQPMNEGQLNSILNMPVDKKPQVVLYDSVTFSSLPDGISRLNQAGIQAVIMEEANANVDRGYKITDNDSPYQTVKDNVQVVGKMMNTGITVDGKHPNDIANDFNNYYDNQVKDYLYSLGTEYHYSYADPDYTSSSYGRRRWTYYVDSFEIDQNSNVMSASDYQNYMSFARSIASILKNDSNNLNIANNWTGYPNRDKYRYTANLRYGQENNFFTSALHMVNVENFYTNTNHNSYPITTSLSDLVAYDQLIVKSKNAMDGEPVELMSGFRGVGLSFPIGEMTLDVQPQGVNSWTSGAPESVLEPLWLATVFHSNSGVDIREKVIEFYRDYYHYNKMDENMLNQILQTH